MSKIELPVTLFQAVGLTYETLKEIKDISAQAEVSEKYIQEALQTISNQFDRIDELLHGLDNYTAAFSELDENGASMVIFREMSREIDEMRKSNRQTYRMARDKIIATLEKQLPPRFVADRKT